MPTEDSFALVLAEPSRDQDHVPFHGAFIARDSVKYLAPDFAPNPGLRYRWHAFIHYRDGAVVIECVEYALVRESRCMEFVRRRSGSDDCADGDVHRYLKDAIKKFAHRHPAPALMSLLRRRKKWLQSLRQQTSVNTAVVDSVQSFLDCHPELVQRWPRGFDAGTSTARVPDHDPYW